MTFAKTGGTEMTMGYYRDLDLRQEETRCQEEGDRGWLQRQTGYARQDAAERRMTMNPETELILFRIRTVGGDEEWTTVASGADKAILERIMAGPAPRDDRETTRQRLVALPADGATNICVDTGRPLLCVRRQLTAAAYAQLPPPASPLDLSLLTAPPAESAAWAVPLLEAEDAAGE